jgi:hypothetical protein
MALRWIFEIRTVLIFGVYIDIGNFFVFVVLASVAIYNTRAYDFILMSAGSGMNGLVMCANGGFMPVSPEAIARIGFTFTNRSGYCLLTENSNMKILSDWLYFPYAGAIFSPGDLFFYAGSIVLVLRYFKYRRNKKAIIV